MKEYILDRDNTFFESLSDMAMATLGIFIIFFVINLLYLNSDFIQELIKQTKLKSSLENTKNGFNEMVNSEKEKIAAYKKENEEELARVDLQIEKIKKELDSYTKEIATAENKVKDVLNVDEVISIEEVRKLLNQVKLKRKIIEEKLEKIRLKTNHVRQEFNIYKEVEGSHPYLEIEVSADIIKLNGVYINTGKFRNIIREINAGSGFRFRTKKQWISGKYQSQKAPDWVNDLLISEGWLPIIDY